MQEPAFKLVRGFDGNMSLVVNADTYEELAARFEQLASSPFGYLLDSVRQNIGATAQQIVVNTLGGSQVAATVPAAPAATALPVVPQPGVAQQPPTLAYPGNCAHGQRVYVDKPARGKPWRRWECAIPWSKTATDRCQPINVDN